ncbi:hypothetical protein [Edaphobacter sp. HDX4]|uniref:hypothetical protein n=1 Tax=Edaphobacter sp. HDX4 TaxID=2794064 RepID=UPI002FE513C2
MFEIIPTEDHDIVREEMSREDWHRTASQSGADVHLTRGSYFKLNGTKDEMDRIEARLSARLKRRFSIEASFGPTYGYGLKPVAQPAALARLPGTYPVYPNLAAFYLSNES